MATAAEIKQYLAVVATARIAVGHAKTRGYQVESVDTWEIGRAEEYLEQAFDNGLEAHGRAVLAEHLAGKTAVVA